MQELSHLHYVVKESDFQLVASQLNLKLREESSKVPSGVENQYYASAVHASESVDVRANYVSDLRIYMECSIIADSLRDAPVKKLLVTEDYKFYKAFVRSRYAEDVLRDLVNTVLHLQHGIRVKLAGEVIPGM